MFKIGGVFLNVSEICKKRRIKYYFSQLIKTHTVSSKRMTLDKSFIIQRSIIYKRKFYSFGNALPLARMHCLARETIASKESWIIRCSRLRHAATIEMRSSSKFCSC